MLEHRISCFCFFLILFGGLQLGTDSDAAKIKPTVQAKQSKERLFFPYNWCLAFKIVSISPHTSYDFHGDNAEFDVKVKVEHVLRDSTNTTEAASYKEGRAVYETAVRNGDEVTFCLSKHSNIDLKRYIESLQGKTQVWAFSTWSKFNNDKRLHFDFDERYEPFHGRSFSAKKLADLTAALTSKPSSALEPNLPIERYLKARWTISRIREFCHKENRLIRYVPHPDPSGIRDDGSWYQGILYSTPTVGQVFWSADTVNGIPISYGLVAKFKSDVWQLESERFDLKASFTDADVLKKRIYDTLELGFEQSHKAHVRPPRTEKERSMAVIYSSTPLSMPSSWREFIIETDPKTRNAVALNCKTSAGKLRVILDSKKDISSVLVDGKPDTEWTVSLAMARREISRLYHN